MANDSSFFGTFCISHVSCDDLNRWWYCLIQILHYWLTAKLLILTYLRRNISYHYFQSDFTYVLLSSIQTKLSNNILNWGNRFHVSALERKKKRERLYHYLWKKNRNKFLFIYFNFILKFIIIVHSQILSEINHLLPLNGFQFA